MARRRWLLLLLRFLFLLYLLLFSVLSCFWFCCVFSPLKALSPAKLIVHYLQPLRRAPLPVDLPKESLMPSRTGLVILSLAPPDPAARSPSTPLPLRLKPSDLLVSWSAYLPPYLSHPSCRPIFVSCPDLQFSIQLASRVNFPPSRAFGQRLTSEGFLASSKAKNVVLCRFFFNISEGFLTSLKWKPTSRVTIRSRHASPRLNIRLAAFAAAYYRLSRRAALPLYSFAAPSCSISVDLLAAPRYQDFICAAVNFSRSYEKETNPSIARTPLMGLAQHDVAMGLSPASSPTWISLSTLDHSGSKALWATAYHQSMNGDLTSVSSDQTSRLVVINLSLVLLMARDFVPTRSLLLVTGVIAGSSSVSNTAYMKLLARPSLWVGSSALSSSLEEKTFLSQWSSLGGRVSPVEIPGTHSNTFSIFLVCVFYEHETTMRSVSMTTLGAKGWTLTSRNNVTRLLRSGFTAMLLSTHSSHGLNPLSCSSEILSFLSFMFLILYYLSQRMPNSLFVTWRLK